MLGAWTWNMLGAPALKQQEHDDLTTFPLCFSYGSSVLVTCVKLREILYINQDFRMLSR
jgi:hypothetical protein